MASSKYHIKGIVDEVLHLGDGSLAPLDYKFAEYKERIFQTHKYQSVLYALLIKENYQKMARNSRIELEQRCGRYGIDYVEADVNQGFEGILLPYFFKRQKLY